MPHVIEPPSELDGTFDEPEDGTPIFDLVTERAARGMLGKDLEVPKQPAAVPQSDKQDGELA